jgi:hypothetical protein
MSLQFKFHEDTSRNEREEVLQHLSKDGAERIRPLFPGEADEELSTLYILDYGQEATGRHLLEALRNCKAVEFAELPAARRLLR